MKILLAETAGFCMGVRRAMSIAVQAPGTNPAPVCTLGPLIHNEQALEVLAARGVHTRPDAPPSGTVILRAHGVAPRERAALEASALHLVDATCPHVLTSQKRITRDTAAGHTILLVGDPNHPEVQALAGCATGTLHILSTSADAEAIAATLDPTTPISLLAQTTFKLSLYHEIRDRLLQRFPAMTVHESICAATEERQAEVRALATRCDAIVVVGGRHSANTKRLAEIAAECGCRSYLVETPEELREEAFLDVRTVGVTAGASTPNWVTQAVMDRLERFGRRTPAMRIWRALTYLARARLLTALGATSLAHALAVLMRTDPLPATAYILCAAFVFLAYTVNRRTALDPTLRTLSPVDQFFLRHRRSLAALAGAALMACLASAYHLGAPTFLLTSIGLLISCLYAIPLLPGTRPYRRLKDLPASKDLLVACAWAVVLTGVVTLAGREGHAAHVLAGCGVVVFLLILSQTVILDLRDIESDQLIGVETLPVLVGRKRAVRLVYGFLGVLFLLLFLFGVVSRGGLAPGFPFFLMTMPLYGALMLRFLDRLHFRNDVACQLLVDAQLLLAGGLAWVWGHAG